MSQNDNIIIKNEPIEDEETEFVTEKLLLQDIAVKCEDTKSIIQFETFDNDEAMPFSGTKTIICTESEYLVDGPLVFESIIVKQEPRLNVCDETVTAEQSSAMLKKFSLNSNDGIGFLKRTGEKKLQTKTEEKKFECYICKYSPKKAVYLRGHIKAHIDKKPFACDECNRKFQRKSNLNQHTLIHMGQKQFACDQCDRKCLRKSTLDRHKKTHTGEKSFTCHQCGKTFSRNSTLSHHKLIHTGESPFACDQCDRKFKMKSTLVYHKQTHTGEKPFACDQCDRKFATKPSINQHKRIHAKRWLKQEGMKGKLFCCDQLDRECLTKQSLSLRKSVYMATQQTNKKETNQIFNTNEEM